MAVLARSMARGREAAESRSKAVAVDPAGEPGREAHESMALVDVRLVADDGPTSDIAGAALMSAIMFVVADATGNQNCQP